MLTYIAALSLTMLAQAPVDEAVADKMLRTLTEEQGAPAAAIVAVRSSGETFIRVAGVKQLGSDAPAVATDPWHIGSNHKAITAVLAMDFVEDGKLSLDSTVGEVLGDVYKLNEAWDDVTLRMLLSHRSGVEPNPGLATMLRYIAFGRKSEDGPSKDRKNALKGVLKKAPAQIPGEQYQYSNYGYSIAGEMIEVAGGKPYEVLLRERIWEPLGMEGAMIGAADEPGPDGFRGHRGSPPEVSPPGADNPRIMSPAGTFSYPLAAYSRFMLDQLLGQQGDEAAMLTAESYKLIATAPDDLADYGLGWGLLEDGALRHSGSNTMWYVTTIVAPNDDIAVALFTNYGDSSGMGAMLETLIESAAGTREECAEQGNAPEDCSG